MLFSQYFLFNFQLFSVGNEVLNHFLKAANVFPTVI